MFEALPKLDVLDGRNKDDESVYSDDDYGEEGEAELDNMLE